MANVNFNVCFGTFVNWYFNVNNADEITGEMLRESGYDEDYFDFDFVGVSGIDNADAFAAFIVDNYNAVVNVEIVPDKMTEDAVITLKNGVSFNMQISEIDDFLNDNATRRETFANYNGVDICRADVFGRVLYCAACYAKYPNYFIYCASFDDMTRQIDFILRK